MGKVDKDGIGKGGGKLTKKGKVKVSTNPISFQRYHFNFTKFQSRILNFFLFSQKAKSSKLKGIEFSFFKNNFLTYVYSLKFCFSFSCHQHGYPISFAIYFLRFMIPCSCILVSFFPNCNKGHQKTNLKAEDLI